MEKPWSPWRLELSLGSRRGGEVVARLEEAVVEREGFGSGRSTSSFERRDRLAIVGPNGSGKSTLIAALVGALPLASGRRFVGPGIRFGELEQDRAWLDSQRPLVELFVDRAELATGEARTLLAKFALRGAQVTRPASSLSPESEPAPSSRCSPRRVRTR